MFEETTLYKTSQYKPRNISQATQKLSAFETLPCWNERHQCWCHLWLATGYVKPSSKKQAADTPPRIRWYLYCEYRDSNENNGYVQKAFSTLNAALTFAEQSAPTLELPNYAAVIKKGTD